MHPRCQINTAVESANVTHLANVKQNVKKVSGKVKNEALIEDSKQEENPVCNEGEVVLPKILDTDTARKVFAKAIEVWAGLWGRGRTRKRKLESKGYNYYKVQHYVNMFKDKIVL